MNALQTPIRINKSHCTKITILAILLTMLLANVATAQSGKRTSPATTGSGTRSSGETIGLQGYCPVCVIEMKQWVKGESQYSVVQDGKTYLFPSQEQKQMFLKNPTQYTPVLGGDCIVAMVEMGKRVPGSLYHATLHNDRLYLFSNENAKSMFAKDLKKYAEADLAFAGKCSVCQVEMNQNVQGTPEFTSILNGIRYQFPGKEQQLMFNKNPQKYAVQK